jgi:hypothetical protein
MRGNPAEPGGLSTSRPTWWITEVVVYHVGFFFRVRWSAMAMQPESAGSRWESLQARSHLPEVQAVLRREISRGTIRVTPAPGGGIRIFPVDGGLTLEEHPSVPGPPLESERTTR